MDLLTGLENDHDSSELRRGEGQGHDLLNSVITFNILRFYFQPKLNVWGNLGCRERIINIKND